MTVIDDYLKTIDPTRKAELERIRKVIKQIVPDAAETIGYGMPVFKYKDKYLIGMCNFKNHLSIFPGADAGVVFKQELEKYKTSKGTVQFTPENNLPVELLKKIVTHCQARILKS